MVSLAQMFQSNKNKKNGFTLIELLVVIAIIAVLSSFLMVNFIAVRQRARDAQRKSDLRQIQSALELYKADQGTYPSTATGVYNCSGISFQSNPAGCDGATSVIYIRKVPKDPTNTLYKGLSGKYYYSLDTNGNYYLSGCIENTGDTDTNILKGAAAAAAGVQDTTGCSTDTYYVLQNP